MDVLAPPLITRKGIWLVSYPLIITAFFSNFMLIMDRLILSHYSVEAMNASSIAINIFMVIQYFITSLISVSQATMSLHLGKNEFNKIGMVTWQMIWISLATSLIFLSCIPIAAFVIKNTPYSDLIKDYLYIILVFGFLFPLNLSLSSFFLSIGKITFVVMVSIFSNVLNILADLILVFGFYSIIPELGIKGSAWGTAFSEFALFICLFAKFIKNEYHKKYQTHKVIFSLRWIINYLKISFANGLSYIIEHISWVWLLMFSTRISELHATLFVVGETLYYATIFLLDGFHRSILIISGEYIGMSRFKDIPIVLKRTLEVLIPITVLLGILSIIFHREIVGFFISSSHDTSFSIEVKSNSFLCITLAFLYILLDSFKYIISSILISFYKTKFILGSSAVYSIFIFLLSSIIEWHSHEIYFFTPWIIALLANTISLSILFYKYRLQVT